MDGLVLVHTDARKEGKVDLGAKMPDGRTLMQVYVDAVKSSDLALVEIKTKRPKGEVDVLKINGLVKIPEWGWIVGFGLFADDIEQAYWRNALRFPLNGLLVFAGVITAGGGDGEKDLPGAGRRARRRGGDGQAYRRRRPLAASKPSRHARQSDGIDRADAIGPAQHHR